MSATTTATTRAAKSMLTGGKPRGLLSDALRRLTRSRGSLAGGIVLALVTLLCFAAPLLTPYNPERPALRIKLQEPTVTHLFGTDEFGRDIFTRVLYGGQISLPVGLIALAIGATIGTAIGLTSGYFGGRVDGIFMWFIDVLLAFPGILFALLVVAILGVDLKFVMIAVGISLVPRFARLVRGVVLSAKQNLYVDAARSVGIPEGQIMLRHVLPNVISPVVIMGTLSLGTAILTAAGLSFLGLGAKPPSPEWGAMLSEGRQFLGGQWWIATFPGLAILLTVLSVNLIGDGLRDALDPKLRY